MNTGHIPQKRLDVEPFNHWSGMFSTNQLLDFLFQFKPRKEIFYAFFERQTRVAKWQRVRW
jgi:hypothetical protein